MIREVYAVELLAMEQIDHRTLLHQLEPRGFGGIAAAVLAVVAALAYSYLYNSQTDRRQRLGDEVSISDSLWPLLVALILFLGCVVALDMVRKPFNR